MLVRFVKYLWNLVKGDAKMESPSDTACVCVGLLNSSKYGPCPGAGADATRMSKLLSKYGGTVTLLDKQATVSAVKSALEAACRKKLAIFFYSGHGGRVKNKNAADGSGYSEHLCLNNGALYDYAIWDVISKAKGRVVLIFDCCHSATMYRNSGQGGLLLHDQGFPFSLLKYVAYGPESPDPSVMSNGKDILVWSGCPADNYSYGDDSGGVLTNGILSSYRESRTYDEVWDKAEKKAASQHPVRTVIGTGFDGKIFR